MKKTVILILFVLVFKPTHPQDIVESNNRFSFDIYKLLNKPTENLVFSPASITSAIAMTYAGAKGTTYDEIGKVFYFNKNSNEFNSHYLKLMSRREIKSAVKLFNANSLWIQKGLNIKKEFLDVQKEFYSSSIYFTDFFKAPESSRLEINHWVEKRTENKITKLLKPSAIDQETKLVLVNAIYFKGQWKKKFIESNNTEDNFQISKRKYKRTVFMNNKINGYYYEDKYAEIVDIPYSDNTFCLTVILPKSYKKLKKLEGSLSFDYYELFSQNMEKHYVNLSIPKFDIVSDFDLAKTLNRMGIKEAFAGSANFSGISENENLYINKVVHKATVKIDENGTEAAAATAVVMRKTALLKETVDFNVNRPFVYLIRNKETKTIYFMGKITDPK